MHIEITHTNTGFHVNYRRRIELQVKELARCIREGKAEYRAMIVTY